ncbi:unnamed protein product [Calicophoron daubneyi]|uniref:Protein prenyltransferase alpha subunit repeat-containing protein 1 n=1 Tax=Calicophoron daubneyi TaxID=300641 RepID=A0AAV2U0B3_CALDB
MSGDTAFFDALEKCVGSCLEYDIIPHVDEINHQRLKQCGKALGICSCTSIIYAAYARKPLNSLTNAALLFLLLLSPNTTSFWNRRRAALLCGQLSASNELKLTALILRTYPRSNETIFHRQWVFKQYFSGDPQALVNEFSLCDRVADSYRFNYALWQYRRFLLDLIGSEGYQDEVERLENWLLTHPTDTSGWTYFIHLLEVMAAQSTSITHVRPLITRQLELTAQSLKLYPERECLWMVRRGLLTLLTKVDSSFHLSDPTVSEDPVVCSILHRFCQGAYTKVRTFEEFVHWCYSKNISGEPSTLKWKDIIRLRHMFWLARDSLQSSDATV